ncbi:hypothetical protein F4554_000890 [Actinopolymorpha rutila]|uniref:Uncharacterized protein n=1 Tax=Actinopolymorpha rutila TaxID=446787 RepID=A0A852Z8S1_9ACTN|nr:hypothetical protein [Actinopolymorpha rutila]
MNPLGPPRRCLWDDRSLDTHPAWTYARQKTRELIPQLPTTERAVKEWQG